MIEIIKSIFDLMTSFISTIFDFKVEFFEGEKISIGIVVVAFVFLVFALYFILKTFKVIGDDKSDSDT